MLEQVCSSHVSRPRNRRSAWSPLLYPPEWALSHHELCFLLPHLLKEKRSRLEVYFSACLQSDLELPDGFLLDGGPPPTSPMVGHAALTPTWTKPHVRGLRAFGRVFARRHDLMSQETHFFPLDRIPAAGASVYSERGAAKRSSNLAGQPGRSGRKTSSGSPFPGRSTRTARSGIRQYFESPYRPGERNTVDEILRVGSSRIRCPVTPGGGRKRRKLDRPWPTCVATVLRGRPRRVLANQAPSFRGGTTRVRVQLTPGCWRRTASRSASRSRGAPSPGFNTPSRKLELYSNVLADWKWPEQACPNNAEPCAPRGDRPSRRTRGSGV